MTARNLSALKAPIMGRVVCLCVEIDAQVLLLPKRLQHTHGQDLLNNTRILFKYAMRQLKGADYYKRAMECTEEIQSSIYFIQSLPDGWNDRKVVARLDAMCDDIADQLGRLRTYNAGVAKSKDECK